MESRAKRFLPLLSVAIGLGIAVASVRNIVPRVRLVEALLLFASSFGAGAAIVAAVGKLKHTD